MSGGVHGRSRQAVARRSKRARARAAPAAAWRGPADRALVLGGGVGRASVFGGERAAGGRARGVRGAMRQVPGEVGPRRGHVELAAHGSRRPHGKERMEDKELASRGGFFPARAAPLRACGSASSVRGRRAFLCSLHSGTREREMRPGPCQQRIFFIFNIFLKLFSNMILFIFFKNNTFGRAYSYGVTKSCCRAMQIDTAKSVSFERKKNSVIFENSFKKMLKIKKIQGQHVIEVGPGFSISVK